MASLSNVETSSREEKYPYLDGLRSCPVANRYGQDPSPPSSPSRALSLLAGLHPNREPAPTCLKTTGGDPLDFQKKYPYLTEFDVLDFIPKLSSEGNYENWKLLMWDFISSQGLLEFVNGMPTEPMESMAWKRANNLVRQWILATLKDDIRLGLLNLDTAEDMWIKLGDLFEWTDGGAYHDEELDNPDAVRNRKRDLQLHKAAIYGHWDKAEEIIAANPGAVRTPITTMRQTVLYAAVQSTSPQPQRDGFVRELLKKMDPEDVKQVDSQGYTALHYAAIVDYMEAANMLVEKCSDLPNVSGFQSGDTALQIAACCGHKDMVVYLGTVTKQEILWENDVATSLLCYLISGELYDIALTLLKEKPELALVRTEPEPFALLAEKHSSFRSGNSLNFWQRLIYWGAPIRPKGKIANFHEGGGRGDHQTAAAPNCCISVKQRLGFMVWGVAEGLGVQRIWKKRERQHYALELVEFLCKEVANSTLSDMERKFKPILYHAVHFGIPDEIIEEIALADPSALFFETVDRMNFIKYAIMYRRENVFNLVYHIGARKSSLISSMGDITRENGLHLAAHMGRKQQIYHKASPAGALLQMQREMLWFKEVDKFTRPGDKERRNRDGKTPAELFSDTHKGLVKEGEQWMKDKAGSCTIVSALVAGMAFAAAITVPGGNDNASGHPLLSKQKAFLIFGICDAMALFSSITSVLMFLLILNSRYAEVDFLHTLPSRLITGLLTLFFSILSTMMSFGAILYLVLGGNKAGILIPIVALAIIPAILFGVLQLPLLVEMIRSTYCRGIFGKQSRHMRRD